MNQAEWHHVLSTEPATAAQVGAILAEFARLGVDDRAERLAISAELLGLDDLGSTRDLVLGDAGRLVNLLQHIRDRAELPDVPAAAVDGDEDQADDPPELQTTLAEVLARAADLLALILGDPLTCGAAVSETRQSEIPKPSVPDTGTEETRS